MSLAERTRNAVDRDPILYAALSRGIVNYAAVARSLAVTGPEDAISDALRRYAGDLDWQVSDQRPRIRLFRSDIDTDQLSELRIDPAMVGTETACVHLSGVSTLQLAIALLGLRVASISVNGVHAADSTAVILIDAERGPEAVRILERTLD